MLSLRVFGIWLLILILAVMNGAFREAVLIPALPRTMAFLISGIMLASCIVIVSFWLVPRLGRRSAQQYWGIGAFWLALTLAFEFGFGYFVRGLSGHDLLGAYTFQDGNIWPLILLAVLVAPRMVARLRKLIRVQP